MREHIDVRLVPAAVVVWPATAVALRSVAAAWATAGFLVVVASAAAVLGRSSSTVRTACLVLVAATGLGAGAAAAVAVRVHDRERAPIAHFDGAGSVLVTLDIDEWPRQRSGDPGGHLDASRVLVPATAVSVQTSATVPARGSVLLLGSTVDLGSVVPGERIAMRATVLRSTRPGLVAAVLVGSGEPTVLERAPPHFRAAARVRRDFAEVSAEALAVDAAGLLPALVLGDESRTLPTVRADFQDSGLTHLTAVSGANFAIVALCVLGMCAVLGLSVSARAAVTAVAIVAFVGLVGPTGSVVRAAVMGLLGIAALALRRGRQPFSALLAAIVILLLVRPPLALDIGFALSVAATAGLIVWAPVVRDRLVVRRVPDTLAGLLAVTVVAQVVTLPLVLALSGRVPLGALPANLLAGPVVPVITVVGTVAAMWSPVAPLLAEVGARATGPELWWVLHVARWCAELPVLVVPGGTVAGLLLVVGFGLVGAIWQHVGRGRERAGARGGGDRGPPGRAGRLRDRGGRAGERR
ncbi:ComEC/Rec2-related protein OS=Tsukamurella paurometabola (strain ATCC 8368 / DSM / CCUG 35730/ CIP 100753 / JCM 10117 / KCTC 9821 / NBRC 16120 / NCIMB 702349 / NCTC 13040) OX=521096 GN=Tpau_2802 PE=4 SV=1 [Tsukamurella paurometabola]|uniref:ComEC/Rec2-related protein n=1 Tax=Tsukamurella paurometabola (strain ATCC 8368 / DSM 20162 / CCUG 35730 / CIP 100753 / JCM 10117 / KCTC 9821 / NBRC 16120 / NCIMB 702349 / NCTC 13040) TaxID=521096 RepID=D5UTB5_TSUPD|nr:ComEC/Rec2 family competence protein [Tsukamurella paurometabola]ADG79400.1 ComEC/Rec2-related protein [Tsukamurella paurometabola DSM 20162]SUP35565.1 ComEC family competence protein [Tsukamurella paurometabola]